MLAPFALLMVAVSLVFSLVNRKEINGFWLRPFMGSIALVIVFTIGELLAQSRDSILVASHLAYTFLAFVPLGWFLACADQAEALRGFRYSAALAVLVLIPATTVFLAWNSDRIPLLWIENEIVPDGRFLVNRVIAYGNWFWVHIAYAYALYLAGTALIFRDFFLQRGARRTISVLGVIATSMPLAFNLLYILRLIPGINRDFSTLVFAPTSFAFIVWASRKALMEREKTDGTETTQRDGRSSPQDEPMSRRERAVYDLLVEGLSNKEIAARLCISENTAKTHTSHIFRKLRISNRQELREKGRPVEPDAGA
jgi:DNA-binding CsgD family transcriptional regulator